MTQTIRAAEVEAVLIARDQMSQVLSQVSESGLHTHQILEALGSSVTFNPIATQEMQKGLQGILTVGEQAKAAVGDIQARVDPSGVMAGINAMREADDVGAQLRGVVGDIVTHVDTTSVMQAVGAVDELKAAAEGVAPALKAAGQFNSSSIREAGAAAAESGGAFAGMGGQIGGAVDMIKGFVGAQVIMSGISKLTDLVHESIFGMNASLETSTLQFSTLMGSTDKARDHVKELFDFATHTPFATEPIIQASRIMRVFGGDALDNIPTLTQFGNAAAATGAPLENLGAAMSKMYAEVQGGHPIGMVARELMLMGVVTPVVTDHMEELQKQGRSSAEVWGVMTDYLHRFDGAMTKQAHTWTGMMTTFTDTLELAAAAAFKPFFSMAEAGLLHINQLLGSGGVEKAVTDFASTAASVLGAVGGVFGKLVAAVRAVAEPLLNLRPLILGAAAAFVVFQVASAVGGVLAGVAGAVTVLTGVYTLLTAGEFSAATAADALAVSELAALLPLLAIGAAVAGVAALAIMLAEHLGLVDAKANLLTQGMQAGRLVIDAMARAWTAIAPVLSGAVSAGIQAVTELWSAMQPALVTAAAAVQPLIAQLVALWPKVEPGFRVLMEVLGVLAAVYIASLAGAFKGIVGLLSSVLPAAINILVDAFKVIVGVISLVVDVLTGRWGDAWQDVLGIVGAVGDAIGNLVVGIFGGIINLVAGFVSGFLGMLDGLSGGAVGRFGQLLTGIWGAVSTFFGSVLEAFGGFVSGIAGVADTIGGILEVMWEPLKLALTIVAFVVFGVIGIFNDLVQRSAAILAPFVAQVIGFFSGIIGGIMAVVVPIVSWMIGTWNALTTGVIVVVTYLWTAVTSFFLRLWQDVSTFVGNLVRDVVNFFTPVVTNILGALGNAWGALSKWGSDLIGGFLASVQAGWNNVTGWLGGVAGMLVRAVGGLGSTFWSLGSDLIGGLISGLADNAGRLVSAIHDYVIDKIPQPIRDALGIHSPSTVAAGIMGDFVAGMVGGAQDNAFRVARAAADLAATVSTNAVPSAGALDYAVTRAQATPAPIMPLTATQAFQQGGGGSQTGSGSGPGSLVAAMDMLREATEYLALIARAAVAPSGVTAAAAVRWTG